MPLLVVLLPSRYDGEAYTPPHRVVFAIPIRREECTPSRRIIVAISTRRGGASHSNAGRGLPPYPQLSTLGGICPPHPFNAAWRDLPPRCIVVSSTTSARAHCRGLPSITTTPLPSKPSAHARFRWQLVPFYNCYPTTIENEQCLLIFDGGLLFFHF